MRVSCLNPRAAAGVAQAAVAELLAGLDEFAGLAADALVLANLGLNSGCGGGWLGAVGARRPRRGRAGNGTVAGVAWLIGAAGGCTA